jgi:hypothetical protein
VKVVADSHTLVRYLVDPERLIATVLGWTTNAREVSGGWASCSMNRTTRPRRDSSMAIVSPGRTGPHDKHRNLSRNHHQPPLLAPPLLT